MEAKARPPLIIIGMHRSGTSMVARILEGLGLFLGYRKQVDHEAIFFLRLNEWILRQANASWDNPYNLRFLNNDLKRELIRVINLHLKGWRRLEYLGIRRFLKYKDIRYLDFPWGWKDPRNTFAIDVWEEIFPDAKILHIYRNPIDVAESLRRREDKLKVSFKNDWEKVIKESLLFGKVNYQYSVRVQDVLEGVKLWEEYVSKALSLDERWGGRLLHVGYEAILNNPEGVLENLINFAGLQADRFALSSAIKNIKSDRRFAFVRDKRLVELYLQIRGNDIMKRLGYHNIL